MTYSKAAMFRQLVRHEGLRLKPYADTVGKITIGVGRNLTDNGISELEAEGLCIRDMADVDNDLDRNIAWWREMTPDRQMVFVDMCFNLGWHLRKRVTTPRRRRRCSIVGGRSRSEPALMFSRQ
jgi:lysozyme